MTGPVRVVLAMAFAGTLSLSAPATAAAPAAVHLDPGRVFSSVPAKLLGFGVLQPAQSPLGSALFSLPDSSDQMSAANVQPLPLIRPLAALPGGITLTLAAREEPRFNTAPGDIEVPAYTTDTPLYAEARTDLATAAAPVRFGAYSPYVPDAQEVTASLTLPLRLGPVRFTEQIESSQMESLKPDAFGALQTCGTTDAAAPCPYFSANRAQDVVARTNFNLRAGNQMLSLQFADSFERLRNDAPYVATPFNSDLTAGDPQIPALLYTGQGNSLTKRGLDAKLAVPVNARLTVGLQYDQQRYQNDYNALLFPAVDARKDTYLGNVTYQLPNSSSAITFSARHYRYQDTYAPVYNLQQTRADVDFTVKF